MAITLDQANNMETIHQDTVKAVTVVDIMEMVKAPSYIIKTDIQKYDCKVIFWGKNIFRSQAKTSLPLGHKYR